MKVYAREDVSYHSDDEFLIKGVKSLLEREIKSEIDTKLYNTHHKRICDIVRNSIGIQDILGLLLAKDESSVLILRFDVIATGDNFYKMHRETDEEGVERMYIEVEDDIEC